MATSNPQDNGNAPAEGKGQENRSGNLLPADDASGQDGRFDVAEEINMDQQSDQARRVGQLPSDPAVDVSQDPGQQSDG